MRTTSVALTIGALSAGLLLTGSTVATAHPKPAPTPVVKSTALAAPFNLEVTRHSVLVADGGLNLVGRLKKDGSIGTIAADQPGASGVAKAHGRIAFTTTVSNPETFENSASGLNIWGWGKKVYADTTAYETKNNPDQKVHYGVKNPSQCVSDTLTAMQFPVSYTGGIDSHAYSVAAVPGGWVVADAGANALFSVTNNGRVKTLAVLPAQPFTFDAAAVAAMGLPDCFLGVTYAFESVPTDVELGRDGFLYVTTLPGGPESPALGARGKLYRVNPWTGRASVVASGFLGATNLAIGSSGEFYVAELFAGTVTKVQRGRTSTFAALPGVVAVETGRDGSVWAGTMASEAGPGTIVKFAGGRWHREGKVRT